MPPSKKCNSESLLQRPQRNGNFFFSTLGVNAQNLLCATQSWYSDNKISEPGKFSAEAKTTRQQCNIIQKRCNSIGNSQLALMAHSFRLIFLGCLAFGEMGAGKITPACQQLSIKALLNRAIALQLGRHPKPPWSLEMVWGDGQGPELCLLVSFLWYGEGLDNVPLVVVETPSLTTHGHDRALCSAHGGGLICGQPKPTKLPFRPLARPDNTTWNDKPKSSL